MPDYKKEYAYLVGEIDRALDILDRGNLMEVNRVKEILHHALLEAEERIVEGMDEGEGE